MANIYLQTCSATEAGQQWVAMTDGRIALAASSPRECSLLLSYRYKLLVL